MTGTQIVINNMTPEDVSLMLKGIVEATLQTELSKFAQQQEMTSTLPEYLTVKRTAEVLGISRQALQLWSKDTDKRSAVLVPFKIGGSVRYKRGDVLNAFREMRRFADNK